MRTITTEVARRSILARQGLIGPFADPHEAVRAMVAVQTQYASSLSVAVAARTANPKPGWDDEALAVGGSLIKAWSVRNTLHAHLPEDYALWVGTLGEAAYRRYLNYVVVRRNFSPEDVAEREARIVEALADGPLTREQLHDRVPDLRNIEMVGWGLDVMGLACRGRLCIVGRGSSQSFALLSLPDTPRNLGAILRRYLEAFGPATIKDFSHWTGLSMAACKAAVHEAEPLEHLHIKGLSGERLAVAGTLDNVFEGSLGVRLLAKFDPLVLAHHEKTLFIPEGHRTRVFRKAAQVEAVVLSEGLACATWRLERRGPRAFFTVEPFGTIKIRERSRIEKDAASMSKKLCLQYGGTIFV